MGVLTYESEVVSAVPAAKLFKVFLFESHIYAPKILPQTIKNIEILQGDGGVGTIKKTNFADGFEVKYIKHKIDAVDKDNFTFKYTSFEGEPWLDTLDKVVYETQVVPTPDGGSVTKFTTNYSPKGDAELDVNIVKRGDDNAIGMFKAVEAYLLANPDV
ncbi:major allergen Pru ar 1 [Jatropha curcas]|uniref:major allergen Pru ar 1 n=1 Tax=Jatropha curcas TaxID=180498 RepID=UPI0005FB81B8|nr:major allergen Pru ar 1 [Jatropha curcas]